MSGETQQLVRDGAAPDLQGRTQGEAATSATQTGATRTGVSDLEIRYRQALVLWLQWNEAHEQATAKLFAAGQDAAKVREFMDMLDQLRNEAISLSRQLLD